MKTLLIIIVCLLATASFGQKLKLKDVPLNIKESFQRQYPKADQAKWSKEDNTYEVEFHVSSGEISVLLDSSGQILETESEIAINHLPVEASEYVKRKYKTAIKEAAKIVDAKGVTTYEAEIKGLDLIFDINGKFITERKN